jgi:hypothetical protein
MTSMVIGGPSGVGKTTLIEKLKAEMGSLISHTVGHTTRAPREGEVNGTSYWFVDQVTQEPLGMCSPLHCAPDVRTRLPERALPIPPLSLKPRSRRRRSSMSTSPTTTSSSTQR